MKFSRKITENKGSFSVSIPKYIALELKIKKGFIAEIERIRKHIKIRPIKGGKKL